MDSPSEHIDASSDNTESSMPFTEADMCELRGKLAAERLMTEERVGIEGGDIVRITPEITRKDEATGEDVLPLLFVRGMGAAEATSWYLKELAYLDQRPVITVQYKGLLRGSSALDQDVDLEGDVSQIDVHQAEDINAALETMGVEKVDAIAESRGAIRTVVAMLKYPGKFRNVVLDHPAGQDDRTYRQAHIDAVRERIRRIKDHDTNALPEEADGERRANPLTRFVNARREQKSVARARLHDDLQRLDPEIHVTITGDANDRAFLSHRLNNTAEEAMAAGAHVDFVETNWGGHGYRYSTEALEESVGRLRVMERQRAEED